MILICPYTRACVVEVLPQLEQKALPTYIQCCPMPPSSYCSHQGCLPSAPATASSTNQRHQLIVLSRQLQPLHLPPNSNMVIFDPSNNQVFCEDSLQYHPHP